jgi:hypothetical protein
MAIELGGGELVRAMVSASHHICDENARLGVPITVLFRQPKGLFEACRGLVDVTDRTTLCSVARILSG